MKIAHLILAHKSPEQLKLLITALNHPAFDFYIHIDGKADETPFRLMLRQDNVFFITDRAKIYWGAWGTIQATINGFKTIIPKGYDYINVISGQDFPIKSPEYIYNYLEEHRGKEFITCDRIEGDWSDVASRIQNYHLINWRIPAKHYLEKIITFVLPARVFPLKFTIVGRANWFTLSTTAAQFSLNFLDAHPEMVRYFKYCWGADEFIFSTILYNTHFKERIVNNLVYVNWNSKKKGHPRVLDITDFDDLKSSDKLFARKFDMEVDGTILTSLAQWIGKGQWSMAKGNGEW